MNDFTKENIMPIEQWMGEPPSKRFINIGSCRFDPKDIIRYYCEEESITLITMDRGELRFDIPDKSQYQETCMLLDNIFVKDWS